MSTNGAYAWVLAYSVHIYVIANNKLRYFLSTYVRQIKNW